MANHGTTVNTRRFSLRTLLALVAAIALFMAAARFSIHTYNSIFGAFDKFTAVWLTHDMLIAHVNRTNGDWPMDWEDLQLEFASINSQAYGVPDLNWVRGHIVVNFDFDPSAIGPSTAETDNKLQVMKMADGTENGEIQSANRRIRSFVVSRRSP